MREALRRRIASAYNRGLLVPFLGAGMSAPLPEENGRSTDRSGPAENPGPDGLPLWGEFVARLEERAPRRKPPSKSADELVERAAFAVRQLRYESQSRLVEGVRAALSTSPCAPTPQLAKLAKIEWPLVVTTNYDDLYVAALAAANPTRKDRSRASDKEIAPVELLGRSHRDCQELVAALRRPARPLVWALQGYVGGQAAAISRRRGRGIRYRDTVKDDERYGAQVKELEQQLVVGHADYRRVAWKSEHFRRAFAEVFRSRSFLFLGSSLSDKYFLDLFSQVVELQGPSPVPHFAFIRRNKVDTEFLRQYFGIWVLELDSYRSLPDELDDLARRVKPAGAAKVLWETVGDSADTTAPRRRPRLRVMRGDLPLSVPKRECIVVSAGGTPNRLHVSHVGRTILENKGLSYEKDDFKRVDDRGHTSLPIWQHRDFEQLLAVNARMNPWARRSGARIRPLDPSVKPLGDKPHPTENAATLRDIRLIEPATRQLLNVAGTLDFRRVHSMLLAAGSRRTFPRSSALLQMTRGWSRRRLKGESCPDMTVYVHIGARDVQLDISSHRIELAAGLEPEQLDFWIEIEPKTAPYSRFLCLEDCNARLLDVIEAFDVRGDDWALDVRPAPTWGFANWRVRDVRRWERAFDDLSLERFGLLPGSILRVSRL